MPSRQLIRILRSLTPQEIDWLNDFIYSPYFNKSKTVNKFWEAIKVYAPDFDDPALEKEKLFEKVFEGKEYNYGTMKNLIHTFTGLVEYYLESQTFHGQKFQRDYDILLSSILYFQPELFSKKFSKMMKEYEKISMGGENHYLYKYLLSKLSFSMNILESKKNAHLFLKGESLINFSLIHIFQAYYNIRMLSSPEDLAGKNNLTEKYLQALDIKKILNEIKLNNPKDFEVVNLYYHMYLCCNEPENDEYFYNFKKLYFRSSEYLHSYHFNELANAVTNTLTYRSYMGIEGTQKETAEYFKKLDDLNIDIGMEFQVSIHRFSLYLKHFFEALDNVYAKKFYVKYRPKLLEKDRENMDNYYSAYENYAEKNFNKALEFSAKIKPEVDRFKLYVKELQLKCYFELNEPEAFGYTINAYRQLIYRSDFISKNWKEYTKNFLNTINSLFEYKVFKKEKLDDIRLGIKNNKMLNKEWIIQKLKEIK